MSVLPLETVGLPFTHAFELSVVLVTLGSKGDSDVEISSCAER